MITSHRETKPGMARFPIPSSPSVPARHVEFLDFFSPSFFLSFMSQLQEMEHSVPEALIVPQAQTTRLSLRWTTWRKHSERLRRCSADPRRRLLRIDASHKKKKKAILCSGELALRDMIHELGKAGCFLEVIGLSALMKRSSHSRSSHTQLAGNSKRDHLPHDKVL